MGICKGWKPPKKKKRKSRFAKHLKDVTRKMPTEMRRKEKHETD